MRGCGADDKLLQLMIREAIEMSEGTKEQMSKGDLYGSTVGAD